MNLAGPNVEETANGTIPIPKSILLPESGSDVLPIICAICEYIVKEKLSLSNNWNPKSIANAIMSSLSLERLRGSPLRKMSVSKITVSPVYPGIRLSKVSVTPSPSISHSAGSLSAIPSPSVSTHQSLLFGKSSTILGRPSPSLSFNPKN